MRTLIHIPVLHSPESIVDSRRQFPPEMRKTAEKFWTIVNESIERISFQPPPHLYVESYSGKQISRSQITTSIPEHTLIQPEQKIAVKILERGGILETTDDPVLLRRAQEAYRELEKLYRPGQGPIPEQRLTELINEVTTVSEERTAFTADCIKRTLPEGGTGILFMGANHDIVSKLPPDIAIESLDPRLREILLEVEAYRQIENERRAPSSHGENKG